MTTTPPYSIEDEQAVLGAMLIEPAAIETAQGLVSCADFYRPNHQELFKTLTAMHRAGRPVDIRTVQDDLRGQRLLEAVGGISYLTALFDAVPTAANVAFYAGSVFDKAVQRRIFDVLDQHRSVLLSGVADTSSLLTSLKSELVRACKGAAWDAPIRFAQSPSLPAFPVDALPPALSAMVSEVAASVQVPPEMPALLALSVLGAAAARRCLVQIGDTHSEPLNLYVAVVMGPGGRKSAAVEAMAAPLREAEEDMMQSAAPLLAAAAEERAVADKRQGFLRDAAAKEKNAEKRGDLMRELSECALPAEVPAAPRLLADDVTPEKLAALCAEQGGCMALLSAEGGIFGILAGRYSDGKANLDLFLKGHAGEDVRVDRKSGPPVHIRRARLSLGLAVQPDVLASLSDTPSFRGRGLLGRFLYALPEELAGTRMYQNRPVDPAARTAYDGCIREVLDLPALPREEGEAEELRSLRIKGEALRLWTDRADAVERRQADGGDLASIRDWASKLAGAVARIAAGFHLTESAASGWPQEAPISKEHVLAAWAVGDYLIPHALAAYAHMGGDLSTALARRVLGWIERTGQASFTLRDCHQAHRGLSSVTTSADLLPALAELAERGYLRQSEPPAKDGAGRKAGPSYQVNPLTFLEE